MNKAQELQALDGFIASMPADTYLRPWLAEIRGQVESMIRNDIFPDILPSDSRAQYVANVAAAKKEADSTVASAERQAKNLLETAELQAARIVKNAESNADSIRRAIRGDVARLSTALQEIAA